MHCFVRYSVQVEAGFTPNTIGSPSVHRQHLINSTFTVRALATLATQSATMLTLSGLLTVEALQPRIATWMDVLAGTVGC